MSADKFCFSSNEASPTLNEACAFCTAPWWSHRFSSWRSDTTFSVRLCSSSTLPGSMLASKAFSDLPFPPYKVSLLVKSFLTCLYAVSFHTVPSSYHAHTWHPPEVLWRSLHVEPWMPWTNSSRTFHFRFFIINATSFWPRSSIHPRLFVEYP